MALKEESMKSLKRLKGTAILLCLFCLLFSERAYAYLDPGTGSYILQLILGVLLAAFFAIKIFWKNIKASVSNLFSKRQKNGEDDN